VKTIQADIPDDLAAQAQEAAARQNQTFDQFVVSALTKQVTTFKRSQTLEQRAKLGDPAAFRAILDRVPNVPPIPGDEL
jgi:hypothetical protein